MLSIYISIYLDIWWYFPVIARPEPADDDYNSDPSLSSAETPLLCTMVSPNDRLIARPSVSPRC